MKRYVLIVLVLTTSLALTSCGTYPSDKGPGGYTDDRKEGPANRGAMALEKDWYGDAANRIVYLNQNWSSELSLLFYFTTQGSELLPYKYFTTLEQADNENPFTDPYHMSRFRFLPQKKTDYNPDALPVGFARNKNYVGLTCGACHTGQINYKGVAMRIDGAPTMSNFVYFLEELVKAIRTTLQNTAKFNRFAHAVLGENYDDNSKAELQAGLRKTLDEISTDIRRNHTTNEYGFARVDAVGRIFNQVVLFTSGSENSVTPDAPASYPFVWDTPQHDYVQWIGLTSNAGPGSLGRNAGEVIGVFGKVDVVKHKTKAGKLFGYKSTVKAKNLVKFEEWMRKLESPVWPGDILPPINANKMRNGEELYKKHCIQCHKSIDRSNPKRLIKAQMYGVSIVKTDKTEAENAVTDVAPTGILQGAIMPRNMGTYGAKAPVAVMLIDLVEGVLTRNVEATVEATVNAELHGNGLKGKPKEGNYQKDTPQNPFASLVSYKARPLNGIWATAPFLHNGSVPTLYDLLLPEDTRPKKFSVGQLEYDPKKIGFISDPSNPNAPFIFDVSLKGNGNGGHMYGTTLSDEERWDLVEYLKSL